MVESDYIFFAFLVIIIAIALKRLLFRHNKK